MLKVELENDNVHSFDTRWDVTVVAMKKQPLRGNSEKFRTATAVTASAHSSYCSTNRETTPDIQTYWSDTWIRKCCEKHFSFRERQLEKPASGAAAAQGESQGQAKETVETTYNGQQKVSAFEEVRSREEAVTRRKG